MAGEPKTHLAQKSVRYWRTSCGLMRWQQPDNWFTVSYAFEHGEKITCKRCRSPAPALAKMGRP